MAEHEAYRWLRNTKLGLDDYFLNYCNHPPVLEREPADQPVDYYALLEGNCLFPERLLGETPVATVTAPVGVRSEQVAHVLRSMRVLEQAIRADDCGPFEVVVWGNVQGTSFRPNEGLLSELPTDQQIIAQGLAKYTRLREALAARRFDPGLLRVRTAFDTITYDSRNVMVRVRRNALEALLVDGAARGLSADHPDIWLDGGDLLHIGKQTLTRTIQAIQASRGTMLVKARHVYAGDPDNETPLHERDMAEKTAMVFALGQRLLDRSAGRFARPRYIEECGLGYQRKLSAVGYLDDGGVYGGDAGEARQFETIAILLNGSRRPACEFVEGTRISTSYRGLQEKARTVDVADRLAWDLSENNRYKTYVELIQDEAVQEAFKKILRVPDHPEVTHRSPEELAGMVEAFSRVLWGKHLSVRQRTHLRRCMARLGIT